MQDHTEPPTDVPGRNRTTRTDGLPPTGTGRLLAAVLGSLRQAVLVEDEQGRTVLVNEAYREMFGTADETAGRDTDADLPDPPADRVARVGEEAVLPDGRVVERDWLPIDVDGRPAGSVRVHRDVTGRKRTEERLAAEYERLVELNSAKDRFLATVSHELRTPLTSILSSVELLVSDGGLTGHQTELTDIVERNASRLLRLVTDLLLLARLESGRMPLDLRLVDVAEVTAAAVRGRRPSATARGLDLAVDLRPGPPVEADPDRLGQVLDNLLSNAEKYTPRGGTIRVRAEPDARRWIVTVADTGIGIPPREQNAVFDEFTRASNAPPVGVPGTGLGLAISRRIAELHGGDLSLRSTEGEGTTVTLTLPFAWADRRRDG